MKLKLYLHLSRRRNGIVNLVLPKLPGGLRDAILKSDRESFRFFDHDLLFLYGHPRRFGTHAELMSSFASLNWPSYHLLPIPIHCSVSQGVGVPVIYSRDLCFLLSSASSMESNYFSIEKSNHKLTFYSCTF